MECQKRRVTGPDTWAAVSRVPAAQSEVPRTTKRKRIELGTASIIKLLKIELFLIFVNTGLNFTLSSTL
jgi:hypothetical protein